MYVLKLFSQVAPILLPAAESVFSRKILREKDQLLSLKIQFVDSSQSRGMCLCSYCEGQMSGLRPVCSTSGFQTVSKILIEICLDFGQLSLSGFGVLKVVWNWNCRLSGFWRLPDLERSDLRDFVRFPQFWFWTRLDLFMWWIDGEILAEHKIS